MSLPSEPDLDRALREAFTRHLLLERGPDGTREHRCNELCAADLAALAAPGDDALRAIKDVLVTLERVVTDSESQHPGGWGPDVTTVADLRDCQRVLAAALAAADKSPEPARELPWERPTREGHVRTPEGPDDYCTGCGELWPCSFEQGWQAATPTAPALDAERLPDPDEFAAILIRTFNEQSWSVYHKQSAGPGVSWVDRRRVAAVLRRALAPASTTEDEPRE